jgi:DNA-directed RNA polymerase subunit RPC12/RpoP
MCQLLVGLPTVTVLGVVDELPELPIVVHIETAIDEGERCSTCGSRAVIKDRAPVSLVDLPVFGRRARLVWRKRRWCCPNSSCPVGSWTQQAPSIASPRLGLTDRAGRWATFQVGAHGRTVSEVAADLGCDSHTANRS